jgi:pimeloyl-ACP methyl ester carboxylesterase
MTDPTRQLDYDMRFWRTPQGVRRAYADGRFGQIHYRLCEPPEPRRVPLLCLHLSPSSGRVYAQFIAEMGKDRVAIAPDTPGFGGSDAPLSPPEIPDYAAAMGELMEQLGLTRFDVMGYHTGSRIAVELAQQRPGRVRRVVLVSAPVYSEEELKLQYETMGTPAADEITADGESLLRQWRDQWRWKDPQAPAVFVHREFCEGLLGGATAWWGHRAAFRFQHARELPRIEQPLLLLCPEDDLWTPTLRAREYLKNGRFVELPSTAHGFLDVHTARTAALVQDFLDGPADERANQTSAKSPPPPPVSAPVRPVRRAFWQGPYGPLHYREAKPERTLGTPIVMFHMSPNSGKVFEPMLAELGRDRMAVAPDTPGFGESEAPQSPIEIEDFAATMAKFIDALGLRQVDVMGYHTGSLTCIALALARPDLVRRIVQISSPVFTDAELLEFRRAYAPTPIDPAGTHLRDKWVNLQRFYGPKVPRAVLERQFADGLRGGPASHWGHRAAFNYDLRVHLPKVTQPILVINPNDDLALQSPRGLPLMQNGRRHDLPDHAHGFMDMIAPEFGRVLRGFLDAGEMPRPSGG